MVYKTTPMSKRKQPLTSLLAHNSVKYAKAAMYVKIIAGLEKLKVGGTFYEIAAAAGLKTEQVWKRLSEMQGLQMIFNVGTTRKGESGRDCTIWQITGHCITEKLPTLPIANKPKEKAPYPPKNNFKQQSLEFNTVTHSWDDSIE